MRSTSRVHSEHRRNSGVERENRAFGSCVKGARVDAPRDSMLFAYLAILSVALAGFGSMGPWVIAIGAIALASLSQARFGDLYRRGREAGLYQIVDGTMLRSLGNALIASGAAYGCGLALRLV